MTQEREGRSSRPARSDGRPPDEPAFVFATTTELTLDDFLRGRLRLFQPTTGYRASLDALLLADFAASGRGRVVADLGAGVGIVSLVLALRWKQARFVAVELQPSLCELARRNALENGVADRLQIVEADLRSLHERGRSRGLLARGGFDRVVCNPPFHRPTDGRSSPDPSRATACHEITCSLDDVAAAARFLLAPRGRLAVVYPAERLADLCATLLAQDLVPDRARCVHPRPGEDAQRVLVQAVRDGRSPLRLEPPLFVRDSTGRYTDEARRILGEE